MKKRKILLYTVGLPFILILVFTIAVYMLFFGEDHEN